MASRATWRKRAETLLWLVPGVNLLAGDAHGRRWRSRSPFSAASTDEADYARIKGKRLALRRRTEQ